MIHFFPELAALYHRTLLVSTDAATQRHMWDEWIQELWDFCPDKTSVHNLPPEPERPLSAFFSGTLGKRNRDSQKILGYSSSLDGLFVQPHAVDYADSLFIEVSSDPAVGDSLFRWQP